MKSDRTQAFAIPCLIAATFTVGCSRAPEPHDAVFESRPLEVPAAPGSTGPNLAAGPEGTLVLSWQEADASEHVLRYAVLEAAGWSEPRQVASGAEWFANWADFPSVAPLSGELWAAHWLAHQPAGGYAYDVRVSLSTDGGATWSEPVIPHDDGTPTEHGFVALFPRGDGAGLIWLDGRNTIRPPSPDGITNGMTLRAATVTRDGVVADAAEIDGLACDCCQTDAAVTREGAVAVYRDRSEDEIRDIYAARLVDGRWLPPQPVGDDGWNIAGCPVNGPVIAADGDRLAIAWFTGADERPRIRVARSEDAGATWSAPLDVAGGNTAGHAGVAVLPDERVAVSWICEQPAGGAGLCVRTVSDADELGPVHLLSGTSNVPAFSVPQLARHGELLVAAWTEDSGDGARIASAAMPIASLP